MRAWNIGFELSWLLFLGISVDFTWEICRSSRVLEQSSLFPEGL